MNISLTEKEIRSRASYQSFQKGLEYYQAGAIYNSTRQITSSGMTLIAQCEGSSASSYRLRAELDEGGVRSASCTCPYDWGGDCKHIVALLLLYLHQPDEFSEQKSVEGLLAGMEKEALVALVRRLVEHDPALYNILELAIPAARASTQSNTSSQLQQHQTQVSEQAYRKQILRILKHRGYDRYEDNWEVPAYIDDLQEVLDTSIQFLDAGDAEGALIILRVLLEELTEDYDSDMDYDGDLACLIQDIGMPLAEAVLSSTLNTNAHEELQETMQQIRDTLDEMIEAEDDLDLVLAALKYGWDDMPDENIEWEKYEEDYWAVLDRLKQARLNVLARQGNDESFLRLAKKADTKRYIMKLLELGRVEDAISSSQELNAIDDIFQVAQRLREVGRLAEAITLAERGLGVGGQVHALALWLAPLEESQGNKDMALLAYRAAYNETPHIQTYRHIKQLAGTDWQKIQPALIQRAGQGYSSDVLVDIHLDENNWEAAIKVAESQSWSFNLLEKVADTLIPYRPDWVIHASLKQSDALIAKTQSKLYPIAARWLARAKKAYQQKGQQAEWQAYIDHLRATYARRPALQREIKGL